MKVRRWALQTDFEGAPKLSDFKLLEETVTDELEDGGCT